MPARPAGAARGTWLVLALLAALVLARLAGMELLPLMDSTEARYAEIGRKMAQLGDWVTPWHDWGVPFWGKPPLAFWLTAASFRVFGAGEFAARLPHFLCAVGIAGCAWRLGSLRSRDEGLLATVLLASSSLFYVSAGAVMTDAALVLGTTLAMVGFWEGMRSGGGPRPQRWLLFAGAALGLLAKGPLALVLIGLPLAGWLAATRQWARTWRAFPWLGGVLLMLAVALPWYLLAERRTPGFLDYFLVGEHWHRFVTPGWKGDMYGSAHRFPPGTIWLFAFAAALPWSLLLPAAALFGRSRAQPESAPGDRDWRLYLLAWSLAPLLFFTVARNILWTYALPALPALALLGASLLARWSRRAALAVAGSGLALTLAGVLAFGVYAVESGRAERHSARALVQAYQHLCRGHGPLIYLGSRPFSASFYTDGRAQHVDDPAALARFVGATGACVVVPADSVGRGDVLGGLDAEVVARVAGDALLRVAPRDVATLARRSPPLAMPAGGGAS